jgi:hypothetical protein
MTSAGTGVPQQLRYRHFATTPPPPPLNTRTTVQPPAGVSLCPRLNGLRPGCLHLLAPGLAWPGLAWPGLHCTAVQCTALRCAALHCTAWAMHLPSRPTPSATSITCPVVLCVWRQCRCWCRLPQSSGMLTANPAASVAMIAGWVCHTVAGKQHVVCEQAMVSSVCVQEDCGHSTCTGPSKLNSF